MKSLFILMLCFPLIFAQNETQLSSDEEKELIDHLFKNYNKNILPPHNATQPVTIETGIALIQIQSIDLVQQTLNLESWLRLQWIDSRLKWDEQKYNFKVVRLDASALWRPDVTLLNRADANLLEFADKSSTRHALLYSEGLVRWIPSMSLKVLCGLGLTYYPFDTHNCSIKVGSWRSDVDFKFDRRKPIDMDDSFNNTEWDVYDTYSERSTHHYDAQSDDLIFLTFSIKIRRVRSLYLAMNLFPIAAGISLAITAFLISPLDNKRIGLNLFVLFLFICTAFHLISVFPSVGRHTPAIVSICESFIILIALSIVWNVILHVVFGYLARTKLSPFAQTFLDLRPIKFINQLCKDDACQMDANAFKVNEEPETEVIIMEQSGSGNEWRHFLVVLDKLAFIIFTFLATVILFAFCC